MMCEGRRLSRSHLASTFCFGAGKSALGQLPTCPVDARLVSFVPEADIRLQGPGSPRYCHDCQLYKGRHAVGGRMKWPYGLCF
jgi:hypothetical protein